MEVKIRHTCLKCGGTGRNALSYAEAMKQVHRQPCGGVLAPGQIAPTSDEQRAKHLMTCGYCRDGHNEEWISLNELLSLGM